MKNLKKLFLSGLLLFSASLYAQEYEAPCVVVEQTDGSKTEYLLKSEPRIAFDGETVTLTTSDETVLLKVENVSRAYVKAPVKPQPNEVGIAEASKTAERVILTADGLSLSGLQPGSAVDVYTADGRQLKAVKAAADGTASLNLGNSRSGMIIVKTNNQSFKLIRK